MPEGHVKLRNVMFAPLIIEGKAVGLIGLANKKSDFSERDALIASSFGEYAALALNNSWTLSSIEKQKKSADFINDKLKVVGSLTRHDVRNKLFLIKGKTYLFKKKPDNSPEVLKFLEDLDSIVDSSIDLLDFSSAYEKIGIDELRTVNVGEYFDQAIGLMNPKCIEVINETYSLNVIADALLSKVFYNLLDNSLKHGKKVTRIRLSHKIEKGSLKLIYEDNGVGVAETDKSKIFSDGFSTGNGSGLGLKLIKRIIEYYGWKISEAGESNKGAKFIITIPNFHERK
ncbi:MAG: GAF domain-containing sensor histidine kinase [Candidatus Bathyarchaeota archaeon]|nr:GAF domain-containing sensor histidine kinase [Candidatus Bathyarchaeota archaeon]